MADIDYSPEQEAAHEAELTRLRAIEQAAREYREAWESDAIGDRDGWTIANRDARSLLFALLDDAHTA